MLDHQTFVRLARSRDFLADQAASAVRLEHAAAEACLSKYHYLRLFRKAFGMTPHEFVQKRRIDLARRLLSTTDLSVTEVCLEVGYESLGSFSSLFARFEGTPPTDFRASVRRQFAIRWAGGAVYIPMCFLERYGGG
jgi:AraC-like DNA-binding protein